MRRKDGTLFVADVGWWRVRDKARKHDFNDRSEVPFLLSAWAKSVGLPKKVQDALAFDFSYRTRRLLEHLGYIAEDPEGAELFAVLLAQDELPEMKAAIEARTDLGFPVPPKAVKALRKAEKVVDSLDLEA